MESYLLTEPVEPVIGDWGVPRPDSTVDWVAASDSDDGVVQTDRGPQFASAVGWLRVRDGRVRTAVLSRGTILAFDGFTISLPEACYSATIARMHRRLSGDGLGIGFRLVAQ
jgi:hypothetical protein